MREEVLRHLLIAAVVLALGTVASAALRNAVNAEQGPEYFPQEYVVIYGGIYSVMLILAYAPVFATFFNKGVELRELLCGKESFAPEEFKEWKEKREAVDDSLGLTFSSASALGPALSTLLPVLPAWAANLLGAKK